MSVPPAACMLFGPQPGYSIRQRGAGGCTKPQEQLEGLFCFSYAQLNASTDGEKRRHSQQTSAEGEK